METLALAPKKLVFLIVVYFCPVQFFMPPAMASLAINNKVSNTLLSLTEKLKQTDGNSSFGEKKLIISKLLLTLLDSVIKHKTVSLQEAETILSTVQKNLALFATRVEPDSHEEQEFCYIKSMFILTEEKIKIFKEQQEQEARRRKVLKRTLITSLITSPFLLLAFAYMFQRPADEKRDDSELAPQSSIDVPIPSQRLGGSDSSLSDSSCETFSNSRNTTSVDLLKNLQTQPQELGGNGLELANTEKDDVVEHINYKENQDGDRRKALFKQRASPQNKGQGGLDKDDTDEDEDGTDEDDNSERALSSRSQLD